MAPARKRGRAINTNPPARKNVVADSPTSDEDHVYSVPQDRPSILCDRSYSTSSSIINTPDSGKLCCFGTQLHLTLS